MLVAIVVILLVFLARSSGEPVAVGGDGWEMPGGNAAHTSYVPYSPTGTLQELWNTRLEGRPAGQIVLAGNRVYTSCDNGLIYCLKL